MRKTILAAALAASCSPAFGYFYNGENIHDLCQRDPTALFAYIAGIHDKALKDAEAASFFIAAAQIERTAPLYGLFPVIMNYCVPEGITMRQMADTVCKMLAANPSERHRPAATLIVESLNLSYPCKR